MTKSQHDKNESLHILLIRHGEVASHRGDVPVTRGGLAVAQKVGGLLAGSVEKRLSILCGPRLRAQQTAHAVYRGAAELGTVDVASPRESLSLRNPDIYVGGQRTDMVSSYAAVADQLEGINEKSASQVPFVRGFVTARDRIGWWLRLPDPPGEDWKSTARRVTGFTTSLLDLDNLPEMIIAVTFSPVLRSCSLLHMGRDLGEPPYLAGLEAWVYPDRSIGMQSFGPLA